MNAESWKRAIGEEAFAHVAQAWMEGTDLEALANMSEDTRSRALIPIAEHHTAAMLTAAFEVGFAPPTAQPRVSPEGTRVMFPGHQAVLTARGLLNYWTERGHGWVIFRVEQLARALAGPYLPWMMEIATAYEAQCDVDGIQPDRMVPALWSVFVGGTDPKPDPARVLRALDGGMRPTVKVGTRRGADE